MIGETQAQEGRSLPEVHGSVRTSHPSIWRRMFEEIEHVPPGAGAAYRVRYD